jgi:DNA-binding GntR family transcriptional regulator
LHDGVAARLRSMVFERQGVSGQCIDERSLAEDGPVSCTPLREALAVLAAGGLVERVPQRGCRVVQPGDDGADALFAMRALLQGRCARQAVSKASDAEIGELRRMHDPPMAQRAASRPLRALARRTRARHAG